MTIRRGEPWGHAVNRPYDLQVAVSDAQLARWAQDEPGGSYAVAAGDVCRTVGTVSAAGDVQQLPFDVIEVQLDGGPVAIAVAHVVARRGWWRGSIVAAMNCEYLGDWNVAPRAHPNDGRFDLVAVSAEMSLRARWQARARLPLGTHVPHPDIRVRTATEQRLEFEQPTPIWIDGVRVGDARQLDLTIRPDWFAVHV